jgi:hypothetical protein
MPTLKVVPEVTFMGEDQGLTNLNDESDNLARVKRNTVAAGTKDTRRAIMWPTENEWDSFTGADPSPTYGPHSSVKLSSRIRRARLRFTVQETNDAEAGERLVVGASGTKSTAYVVNQLRWSQYAQRNNWATAGGHLIDATVTGSGPEMDNLQAGMTYSINCKEACNYNRTEVELYFPGLILKLTDDQGVSVLTNPEFGFGDEDHASPPQLIVEYGHHKTPRRRFYRRGLMH